MNPNKFQAFLQQRSPVRDPKVRDPKVRSENNNFKSIFPRLLKKKNVLGYPKRIELYSNDS